MTDHGHYHWNELMTHDAEAAKAFYGETIGWTFEGMNMAGDGNTYWVCMDGEKPCGGIFTMQGPEFEGQSEQWVGYLSVDDIDARLEKAKAAGATILMPAMDMPGIGRFAMLKDPGGAVIGWITPAEEE
ncbi:MAG: VOC family protein [Pseudomonadota bacterium]